MSQVTEQQRLHPHPEPRSYPLMLRTWNYRWWKPVLGLALGLLLFLVVQTLLLGILFVGEFLEGGSAPLMDRVNEAAQLEEVTPWSMLFLNLGLASLTLVVWVVMRVVHGMRFRWLTSVQPGMRWKFFFACLGIAVLVLLASLVLGHFLPGDTDSVEGTAAVPRGQLLAVAIVILLTTPLQAIGEEYGFRGYLMQVFGSLTGSRVAALLASAVLFSLAHGPQNFPLFFDRFAFGLVAGLTVILLGGLEAAIAMHILNNLAAFAVGVAYDELADMLTISESSWWQLVDTTVRNGLFLLLALWVGRRMGLRNKTAPPAPADGPEPGVQGAVQPAG